MRYCSEQESTSELINKSGTQTATAALYEVPVMQTQSQYETVVEHRTAVGPVTWNPNGVFPLYEGADFEAISAASSLFYQYVPSKVRPFWDQK